MFERVRGKITSHFAAHPHAGGREKFLGVTAATPIERKSHYTYQVVGDAAAFEAFKAFERHESLKNELKPTHARSKEIIAGLAQGFAARMVNEKDLPFTSEADKAIFIVRAQAVARRDAKRALRASHVYESNEMEAISDDEEYGDRKVL